MFARVIGSGSYLPSNIVRNVDLEKTVETSDEWIFTRTGIRQRHIAADHQTASDLALEASREALAHAGISAEQLDLIVVATTTPDMVFPSTACILQSKLGVSGCAAFDVQAVCSGFVYALSTAELYVRASRAKYALVVGAEIYSRILDWADRSTCVLFGDGAAAVVLAQSTEPGIIASKLHADGRFKDTLSVPGTVRGGGIDGRPLLQMDGNTVFKFAVKVLEEVGNEVLADAQMDASQVDWFIPHQANVRIIQASAKKLGIPMEKVIVTVGQHGNTSAASIPLALDQAIKDGRIQSGHHLLLEGVGGGFTWGAILMRW